MSKKHSSQDSVLELPPTEPAPAELPLIEPEVELTISDPIPEPIPETKEPECDCCGELGRVGLCRKCEMMRALAVGLSAISIPRHEFLDPNAFAAEAVTRGDALLRAIVKVPFTK